eukprot:CAMPEP_0167759296 /NCGR_PEP_ID=MMETSP0110_2-20121227/10942_1 /TAXON_ID=629695 /ORGANISM="Gymnochlora sp., Strain CCMP2014" /LENGTH=119 /DNA_ID=CAMNT_0007645661 /DNA_START=145 /DNA_END=504 /DNA_ORIENTATION=+
MPVEGEGKGKMLASKKFAGGKVQGATIGNAPTFSMTNTPVTTTTTTVTWTNKPDAKGPKEGVGVNKKAAGGAVNTWMPETKAEREKLSDKMADRVLGGLADLDLPGKKKKRPAWMRKKK